MSARDRTLRVLIIAEHASLKFGGEASLPLHYFEELRRLGHPVWLLTHARTRPELMEVFPGEQRILYIEDTKWHRAMDRLSKLLPDQIAYLTVGYFARIATQLSQRRVGRKLVIENEVDVIHQPIPVSPREPSLLFGLGAPMVIGPMNGGMEYPPGFVNERGRLERLLLRLGRASATGLNFVMPGKRRAAMLLVANERTRKALPAGTCRNVHEIVENGVDLSIWQPCDGAGDRPPPSEAVTYVFVGRLITLKCVDLLLRAFADAREHAPMRLWIIGDGDELDRLRQLADALGVHGHDDRDVGSAYFAGWMSQADCVERMRRSDCLVLPSIRECGGAVVLEAMALGKPVIATAWGGPLDYLDPSCGILVPALSRSDFVDRIAKSMIDLARSPSNREAMGGRAIAKIRSEFAWEKKILRMLDFYRMALQQAAAERPD